MGDCNSPSVLLWPAGPLIYFLIMAYIPLRTGQTNALMKCLSKEYSSLLRTGMVIWDHKEKHFNVIPSHLPNLNTVSLLLHISLLFFWVFRFLSSYLSLWLFLKANFLVLGCFMSSFLHSSIKFWNNWFCMVFCKSSSRSSLKLLSNVLQFDLKFFSYYIFPTL